MIKLYTDGGVIVKNPSKFGGTYAFILVDDVYEIARGSGLYTPRQMRSETVTNNQTELVAVLHGLEYAKKNKIKVKQVISDSQITLGRLFNGWATNNVPEWMLLKKDTLSLRGIEGVFVKGHNGDTWNEVADQMCNEEAINFLKERGLTHLIDEHLNPWYKKVKKSS